MKIKALLSILTFVFLFFACKPNPEKSRQRHHAFREARDKYKITRITDSALKDSIDASTKIFVYELNRSLLPSLEDSAFECNPLKIEPPKPPYVTDYQFICNQNITLKINEKSRHFLENCYKQTIKRDSVIMANDTQFIYVSPVYSDSTYTGVWGVLIDRKEFIRSLK